MDNEEWDLEEVKRLKKRNLIQANVIFLFLFIGVPYIASHTTVSTMMTI
ncbi:hypothetical protein SAMN04490247_1043 [Salimicrobium halophilum]|uniref:Uncharacterized protein n=1 Tax=Salimicrobium halophilum TaxID=86666 RepID=A0A1G8RHH5_9BACI|nr:hypothetical protein SAMN04490247_1043 [Salimicrobium halophilum]